MACPQRSPPASLPALEQELIGASGVGGQVLELNELLLPGSAFSDILKLPLETDDSIHPTPSSSAQVDGPASKKRKKADDDGSVNGTASSTVPEAKFLGGTSDLPSFCLVQTH